MNQRKPRNYTKSRNYTLEFKQSAVQLALRSPSVLVAAKELGIPNPTLNSWLHQFKEGTLSVVEEVKIPDGEALDPATAKQLKDNLAKLLEENRMLNKKVSSLEEEQR